MSILSLFSLEGKKAIVTGGIRGIGQAITLGLAEAGADVAIFDKNIEGAEEVVEKITQLGRKALFIEVDVTKMDQVESMVDKVAEEFRSIDILVNNAGMTHFVNHDDLEGMKEEFWDDIWAVNVKGLFFCCRAAAPELKKTKGVIINISSIAGLTGLGSSIAYSASKAAAISVTKSLARVLAPEVRVNSVAPGVVRTRWIEGQEEHIEHLAGNTPMQRVAVPEDVAELVYGMIAHAGFVTGQTVVVDGGAFI